MTEATQTQLKILVERVVRPVAASQQYRKTCREALLAEVTAMFDEEFAHQGNEELALAQTTQRWGSAELRTQRLQAEVSQVDAVDRWFSGNPERSGGSRGALLRVATRLAFLTFLLALFVFGAATWLGGVAGDWPREAVVFTVYSILLLPAFMFALVLFSEWIRQAAFDPAHQSRPRALLLTIAWFATIMLLFEGLTFLSGVGRDHADPWQRVWLTLWLAVSLPAIPWAFAKVGDARARAERVWQQLPLD